MLNIRKILFKKISFTMLIISVYLLGRKLTLPNIKEYVNLSIGENETNVLDTVSTMTGGGIKTLSIFSLGLGPWMSTLILWKVFSMIKIIKIDELSKKKQDIGQYLLAIAICLLQGIVIIRGYEFNENAIAYYGQSKLVIMSLLFLVSGTLLLIWLGNMNSEYGIGSMIILIVVNMVSTLSDTIVKFFTGNLTIQLENYGTILAILVIFSLIGMLVNITLDRAEYRMPLIRILIDNKFSKETYLPIKLNPSGGMAFMYAMVLVFLPRYILLWINSVFPNNNYILWGIENFTITRVPGIIFYLLTVFLLSIGFGYLNLNIEKTVEGLQKSGDYLIGIRPGYLTEKYILSRANLIIYFSAVYVAFFMGMPMFLLVYDPSVAYLAMFPGLVMFVTGLTLNYTEEFEILKITGDYNRSLF